MSDQSAQLAAKYGNAAIECFGHMLHTIQLLETCDVNDNENDNDSDKQFIFWHVCPYKVKSYICTMHNVQRSHGASRKTIEIL